MNTASRMESHGLSGKIQVSPYTVSFLRNVPQFRLTVRGMITVKRKGKLETCWLESVDSKLLSLERDALVSQSSLRPECVPSTERPIVTQRAGCLEFWTLE